MATVRQETGNKGWRRSPLVKHPDKLEDSSTIIQKRGFSRGLEVGFLMITMIQLHEHGQKPTLDAAIRRLQYLLPKIPGGGQRLYQDSKLEHQVMVRSDRKLRKFFYEYLPVAHYWAAAVNLHGLEQLETPEGPLEKIGLPTSTEDLALFVKMAHAVLERFSALPIKRRSKCHPKVYRPLIVKAPSSEGKPVLYAHKIAHG